MAPKTSLPETRFGDRLLELELVIPNLRFREETARLVEDGGIIHPDDSPSSLTNQPQTQGGSGHWLERKVSINFHSMTGG